jgi:predicted permease
MDRIITFDAIGKLKPGITPQQASDEGTARGRSAPDLGQRGVAIFGSSGRSRVAAIPFRTALISTVEPGLLLVSAAAALLLLVAVANIASVQLVRATARRRELAIRAAIGAGRARIARQVLVENAILGLAGGLAGLVVAVWLHGVMRSAVPAGVLRVHDVTIDWHVLLFALATTIALSAACGLVPAAIASRVRLTDALADGGRVLSGGGRATGVRRGKWFMLVGQVAAGAALLTGALLVTRSYFRTLAIDRGYQRANLLTARLPLPGRLFPRAARSAVLDQIVDRLEKLPGATHAAATDILPLITLEFLTTVELPQSTSGGQPGLVQVMRRTVSRDYLATVGMHLGEGRSFLTSDTTASVPVVLINRTFARRYVGGRSALGTTLPFRFSTTKRDWQVVGVVDDVRQQRADDSPQPEVFVCYCQIEEGMLTETPAILLRVSSSPESYAGMMRDIAREVVPGTAVDDMMTMDDRLRGSVAGQELSMTLLLAFAGFAALIVGLGLFAVLSHSVAERWREIGIRSALGARPTEIMRMVTMQALAATVSGVAIGLIIATSIARQYPVFLFGVGVYDPVTIMGVALALLGVTAVASFVPARRAATIDPVRALNDT